MEVQVESRYPRAFRALNCCVHVVGAVHFWYAIIYDWIYVIVPPSVSPIYSAFSYKLKFLTYWNAISQAVYFTGCIVNDGLGSENKTSKQPTTLQKVKEFFFASVAFPMAMFVGLTFWGLYAVDRELVLPSVLDPYFPPWLNHMEHTNIMIFQMLEMFTAKHKYPSRRDALIGTGSYMTVYLIWLNIVYLVSGVWAYPVLNLLNIFQRILFFGANYATGFLLCFLGERLSHFLWEDHQQLPDSQQNVKYSA